MLVFQQWQGVDRLHFVLDYTTNALQDSIVVQMKPATSDKLGRYSIQLSRISKENVYTYWMKWNNNNTWSVALHISHIRYGPVHLHDICRFTIQFASQLPGMCFDDTNKQHIPTKVSASGWNCVMSNLTNVTFVRHSLTCSCLLKRHARTHTGKKPD